MTPREERHDYLFNMRLARNQAETVCASGNYTQQDWDDLQHFRAEVIRVEAELARSNGSVRVA